MSQAAVDVCELRHQACNGVTIRAGQNIAELARGRPVGRPAVVAEVTGEPRTGASSMKYLGHFVTCSITAKERYVGCLRPTSCRFKA